MFVWHHFLRVSPGIRLVPFVWCQFGAISLVLVPVLGQCLSSRVISAPFHEFSSEYLVNVFIVTDVDVPSLPHPAFQCDTVSIVPTNVVSSLGIGLRT